MPQRGKPQAPCGPPRSHFNLVESDYAWVTKQLRNVAQRYAGERIVSTLEGGYELHALGRSAVAHIRSRR